MPCSALICGRYRPPPEPAARNGWLKRWRAFGLILAILGAIHARANVATTVACYITAAYWFTASTSFANPAVALARSLTDTFAGIRPIDLPGFWGAELGGALLAAALCNWLFADD